MMMPIVIALTLVTVAAIAGWAFVAGIQALSRGRPTAIDPAMLKRLDQLADAVDDLRQEVGRLGDRHEADVVELEQRLDFAERLLTRPPDGD